MPGGQNLGGIMKRRGKGGVGRGKGRIALIVVKLLNSS